MLCGEPDHIRMVVSEKPGGAQWFDINLHPAATICETRGIETYSYHSRSNFNKEGISFKIKMFC